MTERIDALTIARFSAIIDLIYTTVDDTSRWREMLIEIGGVLDATHGVAIIRPDSAGAAGLSVLVGERVHELSDFLQRMPQNAPLPFTLQQTVAAASKMLPANEWQESAFYKKVCSVSAVTDILFIDLRLADNSAFRLRFTRSSGKPDFDEDDCAFVRSLIPHLRQAIEMGQRMARDGVIHRSRAQACDRLGLATFLLDDKCRVIEMNSSAEALLVRDSALVVRDGRLAARFAKDQAALRRHLLAALADGKMMNAPRDFHILSLEGTDDEHLHLLIDRVSETDLLCAGRQAPALVVFARDPAFRVSATHATRELFNLTPAESELVVRLANGLSLGEAAEEMHIRVSTARSHLRAAFAKTGTSRQSSLVRQILNSVGAMATETLGSMH